MSGHTPRWYCVQTDGKALLCSDEEHAKPLESKMTHGWPPIKIYKAVLLVDAEELAKANAARIAAQTENESLKAERAASGVAECRAVRKAVERRGEWPVHSTARVSG